MTLEEIRRYTNTIADKHRSGLSFTEQEFNDALKVVNDEMYNDEYAVIKQMATQQNIPVSQAIFESDLLREFKVYDGAIALASGQGNLPEDYRYYMAFKISKGIRRNVRIISDAEFSQVISNMYNVNPSFAPVGVVHGVKINVIPTDITNLSINYLKEPDIPFYDYCIITSSRVVVYMPVGSYIESETLKDVNGSAIQTGVEHLEGRTESLSVELEWNDYRHPEFSDRILLKMGISLKDSELFTAIKTEQQS